MRTRIVLIILCFLFFAFSLLQAQSLFVKEKYKTILSFPIKSINKLTFNDDKMTINNSNNQAELFVLTNLRYLTFTDFSSNINHNNQENKRLLLFPNPVKDFLTIQFPTSLDKSFEIFILGLDGKILQKKKLIICSGENNVNINLSYLNNGMYLCRIINGKDVTVSKFIKTN